MAAKINKDNYEAYLLDYMEGNLSKENVASLLEFIVLNPELNINLNELETIELNDEKISFENKNSLKKSTKQLLSEEQLINYIENEISAEEKSRIENLSTIYPEIEKELNLYKKTILVPDSSEIFENKNTLKKKSKVIYLFSRQTLAIAAAITLLLGFIALFNYFGANKNEKQISGTINGTTKIQPQLIVKNYTIATDNTISVQPSHNKETVNSIQVAAVRIKSVTENTVAVNAIVSNTISAPLIIQPENEKQEAVAVNTNTVPVPVINEIKNTKVFVITEKAFDEDEKVAIAKTERKNIWQKTRKAIHSLNKMGVKAVDATETNNTGSEQYVLTLGNFSVEKNKYNQE